MTYLGFFCVARLMVFSPVLRRLDGIGLFCDESESSSVMMLVADAFLTRLGLSAFVFVKTAVLSLTWFDDVVAGSSTENVAFASAALSFPDFGRT